MPWAPIDASRFTKKADTPVKKRLWSQVANATLDRTKDEGKAIREANAAVLKTHLKRFRAA